MKQTYARSLKEYEAPSRFEKKKILDAAEKLRKAPKRPTASKVAEAR